MTAWYLKVESAPDRAILVGDRGRVLRAAELLDDARLLNEDRGLTTVLGSWRGVELMVSAFGMGAPIAAIVMHELASLGTSLFVRAGTMMTGSVELGSLIVADRALIHEGTSATYGNTSPDIDLDSVVADALVNAAGSRPVVRGTIATCDGFYTQMTDLLGPVPADLAELWELEQVVGVDMETSALGSVATALGVRFGSLCLATVNASGPTMLEASSRAAAEVELLGTAFTAATSL
jgi:uridine phosphorylase